MDKAVKAIVWFGEVGKGDGSLVGGKGANLSEMTRAQVPVPPGFIVTAQAYYYFLVEPQLADRIRVQLEALDVGNSKQLQQVASQIKEMICSAPMPFEIARQIREAYRRLGGLVAVRSSATAEDLAEASFAGQQRTFLNVQGEDEVVAAVQGCWASLYEPRAIFYRAQQGLDHLKVGIAVPVQRMVQSEAAGVIFTLEPMSNDLDKVVIEALYGLGEVVVSGEMTPDLYVVDKKSLQILYRKVARQEWRLVRNLKKDGEPGEDNIKELIPPAEQSHQKLADADIVALSQLAKRLEDLYQAPQDIEWAKDHDGLYILQSRPITTMHQKQKTEVEFKGGKVLLSGLGASPGAAAGPVRIVRSSEIDRVEAGAILVAEMTTPDFVPAMKRAVGIVTDRGGRTCHAAIVARELGVPCVVGTETATRALKDEQVVTVDGSGGKVYEGKVIMATKAPKVSGPRIRTNTKLYVNLADPELAEAMAARDVDGVGLLRAEFMVAHIGEHPRYMLSQGRGQKFIDELAKGIATFARAFAPRPVVYRTTDFKTNEYRSLTGGWEYEELEENPMLGYRGCSRYIREIDVFRLETEAIKKVRESFSNLWVMLPFVRTIKELVETKKLLRAEGLVRSLDFKLWMMVEVPSNIILLDKFIDVGIDGISIGSNDLTQLTLGVDRDNARLAEGFDERDEAMLQSLQTAVETSRRRGITASICGQAPSFYPDLTEKLVKWGITSVSVSPDMIEQTREIIAMAEGRV